MLGGSCEVAVLLLMTAAVGMAAGTTVRFGALTDVPEDFSALRLAVEYVNENDLVPNVTLTYTDIYNSTQTLAFFDMIRQACVQASESIVAIIGPRLSSQVKATSPVSSGLSLPQLAPDATDPTLDNLLHFPMLLRMSWPDSVLGVTLVDLVEHFGWDHVSIFASNDDYGTHGLVDFQLIAGQKGWSVHTMQSFDPTEDPADIDVTTQLQVIKSTGARIVVLHCLAPYARQILQESVSLGMTGAGWAWVVSDGVTGLHDASGGNGTVPEYLRGLVGPRPPAGNGSHGEAFLLKCVCVGVGVWHDASGGNGTVPEYLRGLVGPRPPAGNGSHGEASLLKCVCVVFSTKDRSAYCVHVCMFLLCVCVCVCVCVSNLHRRLPQHDASGGNGTVPEYLRGLVGPRPPASNGSHGEAFLLKWSSADPAVYPGAGTDAIGPYTARWADAVLALAAALRNATELQNGTITPQPLDCACAGGPLQQWSDGLTMLQYLKQVDTGGVTGRVRFTPTGARADAEYDIVNLREDGWQSVGWWDQAGGLTLHSAADVRFMGGAAEVEPFVSDLRGRHLRVVTVAAPGFVEVSDEDREGNVLTGNDRFQGLCMELLAWLSAELGFTYELYEVADGEYGRYKQENGSWTGMVGDVVAGTADMAAAIVSITSQRQDVGDFTLPFYSNGITLAMRKSQPSKSNWGFVKPFEGRLWATILLTALAVAVFQGVANFLTRKRDPETKAYVNPGRRFIWRDSGFWEHAWQSWVLLVQFSPDFLPRSLSGRTVTFFWGIGVLVAVSTYTANLAAFLTVSSAAPSISSPEDLLTQSEIAYGAVETYASGEQFLTTSTEPYHSLGIAMWVNRESVLVQSVAEGLAKARDENYALFTDSAELDYAVSGFVSRKPCDLKTVGRLFWQTGFGFFLPKDSPYVVEFNRAILRAEEEGVTGELDHKWIKSQECDGSDQSRLGSGVIGLEDMLGWIKSQECDGSDQSRLGSGVIGLEDML
ncbi:glutamate receptor 2-like [Branchiostoma floridae x Branchiostoma belcheri]